VSLFHWVDKTDRLEGQITPSKQLLHLQGIAVTGVDKMFVG